MIWQYLSFCDGSAPKGQQWLGCCIVEGDDVVEAAARAHDLGCNPGGQVACWAFRYVPPMQYRNRLLNKVELSRMMEEVCGDGALHDLAGNDQTPKE